MEADLNWRVNMPRGIEMKMLSAVLLLVLMIDADADQSPSTAPELLRVNAAGLLELEEKVNGRGDLVSRSEADGVARYEIEAGAAAYYFTPPTHPAHPSAMFRGWTVDADGARLFDQRAWTATESESDFTSWVAKLAARSTQSP